jgi:hypothetical protein
MTELDKGRRVRQLGHDVDDIYEILGQVRVTQTEHGVLLRDLDTRVGGLEVRFDGLDAKLDRVLDRLPAAAA